MKIDFIYDCVYPLSKGGAEKRIATYAQILHDAGHDTTCVSMDMLEQENSAERLTYVKCCPKLRLYKRNGNRSILSSFIFGLSVFWFVIRRRDVNIIDSEIFPYFPVLFARLALLITKKDTILVGYWSEYLGENYWRKNFWFFWRIGVMLEYLCFVSCDRIIANSDFTHKNLKKKFLGRETPIDMLPPVSIDMKLIATIPDCKKNYDIVYYGRIIWHKNVEHVVAVVESLVISGYGVRALIIGEGQDAPKIDMLIREKKMQQHIDRCDFFDVYEDLIAKIKSARVMIQPSEREGFGITIVEANACGLPVFVVDYPNNAAKELIIEGQNGFVCSDFADLKSRVVAFFSDNDVTKNLERLSIASIETSRQYSANAITQSVCEIYEKISH